MRPATKPFMWAMAVCSSGAAHAQRAIDRVDPAQVERNNVPRPLKSDQPQVSVPLAPRVAPTAVNKPIRVGAITFAGLHELSPADFADAITPYLGQTLGSGEAAALAASVEQIAHDKGLVFASAWIGPQRMTTGVLVVHVDEGVVDEVRLSGSSNAAVERMLAPLIGRPGRMKEIERLLLLAGDIPGITLYRNRYLREGKRGVLVVDIAEDAQRLRAIVDKDSTAPVGPVQLKLDIDIAGVLAADDSISVTYVATPLEPDELQFTRVAYSKRVGKSGTELSVSGSVSSARPGAYIAPLQLHGQSWSANVAVLQPLQRSRASSLWLQSSFELRNSQLTRRGARFRHDRLAVLRLALLGNRKILGGTLRINSTFSQGLDLFGATTIGDPLASRQDADATFTSLLSWADFTAPLGSGFSARLAVQSQIASQPLLVSEELTIGGNAFLRGYDYSERSGDQGASGLFELRYDWVKPFGLVRRAQIYGFVDGGRVENKGTKSGDGDLYSGGGGIRADVSSSLDANVEVALPLSDNRYETGDHSPRINLRLLKIF